MTLALAEVQQSMRRWRRTALAAAGLVLVTGGGSTYLALHLLAHQDGGDQWVMTYPFEAVAIGGVIGLSHLLRKHAWRTWPVAMVPLAMFVSWSLASAAWSVSSGTTALHATIDVGIVAFGCWFGWALTIVEQIWSVAVACSSTVMASAIVIRWWPRYGKMYPDIAPHILWQGIFGNRNSLAPICGLGLIALGGLVALRPRMVRIVICGVLAVLHLVLLRGSSGATSLGALAAAIAAAVAVGGARLLRRARVPGAAVAGAAASLVGATAVWGLTNLDRIASRLNRSATLSGRRPIWAEVRHLIRVHPLRGWGYWAFWDRADLTADTYARLGAPYGSAHNSALEVMLGLGVVGLVPFLVVVVLGAVSVARAAWLRPSLKSWWWAITMAFVIVEHLTESFVLWHSYLLVLLVAAAFVSHGPTAEERAIARADRPEARLDEDLLT